MASPSYASVSTTTFAALVSLLLRDGCTGIKGCLRVGRVSYSAASTLMSKPSHNGTSISIDQVGSIGAPMVGEGWQPSMCRVLKLCPPRVTSPTVGSGVLYSTCSPCQSSAKIFIPRSCAPTVPMAISAKVTQIAIILFITNL